MILWVNAARAKATRLTGWKTVHAAILAVTPNEGRLAPTLSTWRIGIVAQLLNVAIVERDNVCRDTECISARPAPLGGCTNACETLRRNLEWLDTALLRAVGDHQAADLRVLVPGNMDVLALERLDLANVLIGILTWHVAKTCKASPVVPHT